MKYQSKKNPDVFAAYDFQDEKTKSHRMIYLTGEKTGYSFEIASSTLQRWWKKVEATQEEVDAERINVPYHPDVTPHYIPKPQSVIEYEENKKRVKVNTDLPNFDNMAEMFETITERVNETSKYIALRGTHTTIWRKSQCIDIYVDDVLLEKFVEQGFQTKPNKDKHRPYHIKIKTAEEFDKMKIAIMTN